MIAQGVKIELALGGQFYIGGDSYGRGESAHTSRGEADASCSNVTRNLSVYLERATNAQAVQYPASWGH